MERIRISPESYQRLSINAQALYVDELTAALRPAYPEIFFLKSEEECRALVEREVKEALGLGLSQRETVTRFVEVQMDLGGGLTKDQSWSWLLERFLNTSLPEDDRVREIAYLLDGEIPEEKP